MQALERFFEIQFAVVTNRLKNELDHLCEYHNVRHTLDVIDQSQKIGITELLSERDLLLLKIAALFHDTGFLFQRAKHEEKSVEIFLDSAKDSEISEQDKAIISQCILATRMPQQPISLLDKVICDADLDYLGRDDFFPIGDALFREMNRNNEISDTLAWNNLQVKFLNAHRFHTNYSIQNRTPGLQENLNKVLEKLNQ
jgi:predicted metal-dependent HD superfamily phosphohydrolase